MKKETNLQTVIWDAISTLNASYGKGSICAVRLMAGGYGEFDRIPFGCALETRRFRARLHGDKITIHACGHQTTVTL